MGSKLSSEKMERSTGWMVEWQRMGWWRVRWEGKREEDPGENRLCG